MITIKEQPDAAVEFLRFLVGYRHKRAAMEPVFYVDSEGRETEQAIGQRVCESEQVTVFHVLGFGSTKDRAVAMAKASPSAASFFWPEEMGCSARSEEENPVVA